MYVFLQFSGFPVKDILQTNALRQNTFLASEIFVNFYTHAFFLEQSFTGTFLGMEGVFLYYVNVPAKKKMFQSSVKKT